MAPLTARMIHAPMRMIRAMRKVTMALGWASPRPATARTSAGMSSGGADGSSWAGKRSSRLAIIPGSRARARKLG